MTMQPDIGPTKAFAHPKGTKKQPAKGIVPRRFAQCCKFLHKGGTSEPQRFFGLFSMSYIFALVKGAVSRDGFRF
jgi:hypothetical protein